MTRLRLGTLVAVLATALLFHAATPAKAQSSPFAPCNTAARMTAIVANTILIPHVTGSQTVICDYVISLGLVATTTAQLVWGTGTTCGSSTVASSPKLAFGSAVTGASLVFSTGSGSNVALDVNPSRGVSDYCVIITGSASVDGMIWFYQG